MINISIRTKNKVVDDVEEIFSNEKDKNGNYITPTLGQIMTRKLSVFGKTASQIESKLSRIVSDSTDVYFSTLSLNNSMPLRKAKEIAKKYNDNTLEFKVWNRIEGISLIFINGRKVLSLSMNAIRIVNDNVTKVIFDVYNIEVIDNKKLDPEKYGYKKTNSKFSLTREINESRELKGWTPHDFFDEVKDFSKDFREVTNKNIEKALSLKEWSEWANILSVYASDSNTSTVFGVSKKEFESGDEVNGYVVLNSDWKHIEKDTKYFEKTVSILTSDGNDVWTNINVDEPISAKKMLGSKVIDPLKNRKAKEKTNVIKIKSEIEKLGIDIEKDTKLHKIKFRELAALENDLKSIPGTIEVKEPIKKNKKGKSKKSKEKETANKEKNEYKILTKENPEFVKKLNDIKAVKKEEESLRQNINKMEVEMDVNENKLSSKNLAISALARKIKNAEEKVKEFLVENKVEQIVPINFVFKARVTDLKFELPSYDDISSVNLSVSDIGSIKLARRIAKAKRKLFSASYKNPFLLSSFLNIGKESLTPNKNLSINKPGWEFNEGQLKAIGKMDSNKSTFFLQGPPGTGKTTTISRFAEIQATKGKQILMTSSTKAAITGFIESVEKMAIDNPNIFSILNIPFSERKDVLRYSIDTLYKRHVDKIFGQTEAKSNATIGPELLEELSDLITEQDIVDIEKGNITSSLLQKSIGRNAKNALRDFDGLSNTRLKEVIESLRDNDDFIPIEKQNMVNEAMKSGFLAYKNGIYSIIDNNSNDESLKARVLSKIKKYDRSKAPEVIEKKFNNKIVSEGLINIIAQTNTSRLSLETLSGMKDLQVDFDIDTVIIDEVSKSITLEVLRMASNAKRAIFAGDYRQLPPDNNYDRKAISEIYFSIVKNWNKLKTSREFVWPSGDKTYDMFENLRQTYDSMGEENFLKLANDIGAKKEDEIKDLYKDSLFKSSMIGAIKADRVNSNYEILKESRRFNDSILAVVNTFYDGKEKLIPYLNKGDSKNGKNISFDVFGKKHKGREVYWVDTSYVSGNGMFKNIIKKSAMQDDLYASYNFKTKGSALKNKFNAMVCEEIVSSLVANGTKQNDIGIICLNSGQKNLLKDMMGQKFPGVVIETIGWFQGREKEVIITDFVWSANSLKDDGMKKRGMDRVSFTSYERVNVGVSRAKRLLINVGAYDSYIKNISGDYVYANGKTEKDYPYMLKMMRAIEDEGEVIRDDNK